MYVLQESDRTILPMKLPNKEAKASAEAAEGRVRTKENAAEPNTHPTQSGARVSQGSTACAARRYSAFVRRYSSEVRAVCGNAACTDLRGGRPAMTVPTVTIGCYWGSGEA